MIWSGYDDTFLRKARADGQTYAVIAERLGRSEVSARVRARRLGLATPMAKREPREPAPVGDGESGCKWPSWAHHERPTHEYCGAERPGLGPYCEFHERKSQA